MFNAILSESCLVCETVWQIKIEPDRPTGDNMIRRMRSVCWRNKATNIHSEYVIIIAFPLQSLRRRASLLRSFLHRLSISIFF